MSSDSDSGTLDEKFLKNDCPKKLKCAIIVQQHEPAPVQQKDKKVEKTESPHQVTVKITSKQKVVGIQSLGNNKVTIKDGPDHDAATTIAKQLASGQAKLDNV